MRASLRTGSLHEPKQVGFACVQRVIKADACDGAGGEVQLGAAQVFRHALHEGDVPHRDDACLFTCGKLVEKRIPILLEKAGEGLDGLSVQRGCDRLGRLLGAERRARPNDGLRALVLRKEGERARESVGRGERRRPAGSPAGQ